MCKLSVVEAKITTLAPSFSAACLITSAYAWALKEFNLSFVTFNTLLTP